MIQDIVFSVDFELSMTFINLYYKIKNK